MFRSPAPFSGFNSPAPPVASLRLMKAVVASLVFGAIALCLCVGLTLATSVATLALPVVH